MRRAAGRVDPRYAYASQGRSAPTCHHDRDDASSMRSRRRWMLRCSQLRVEDPPSGLAFIRRSQANQRGEPAQANQEIHQSAFAVADPYLQRCLCPSPPITARKMSVPITVRRQSPQERCLSRSPSAITARKMPVPITVRLSRSPRELLVLAEQRSLSSDVLPGSSRRFCRSRSATVCHGL